MPIIDWPSSWGENKHIPPATSLRRAHMPNITETLLVQPEEYFRERVSKATAALKVDLGVDLEFYIVQMLCAFIKPETIKLSSGDDQDIFETPLVIMLQKAYESENTEQRLTMLRRLGDTSLYVAGYFQDYFNRKTFDIGYYIELGSLAYSNVAQLTRQRKDKAEVFHDLSENFSQLVDVVAEVSEGFTVQDNKDVLAIYDRWTRSNSDRLRKMLLNLGIQPISNLPIKIAQ